MIQVEKQKKEKKKSVEELNLDLINSKIENLKMSELKSYFTENLSSYLSSAQKLALYFGNLRIKYVTFNFTLIAFFASISALYISLIANINLDLVQTGLPLLLGLALYFLILLVPLLRGYKTKSFEHEDLLYYSCVLDVKKYPNQVVKDLDGFTGLFKNLSEEELIKNDLKTLILQYFHQINHDKVAQKLRKLLVIGLIILIISIGFTFFFLSNPSLLDLLLSNFTNFFNLLF